MNTQLWRRRLIALTLSAATLSPAMQTTAQQTIAQQTIAEQLPVPAAQPRLSLFPPVEGGAASEVQVPVSGTPVAGPVAFVLIGTSQIGNQHRARLRNANGETVTVNLDAGGNGVIPGYPGFAVSRVGAREIELSHPVSSPCMGSQEQGVSCLGSHQSRLQLATAAPVARPQTPTRSDEVDPNAAGQPDNNANADAAPADNPFAAALRAARARGEAADPAVMRAEGARFRPRRIDPADVPPGAQLIRTPFGDRIVTQ